MRRRQWLGTLAGSGVACLTPLLAWPAAAAPASPLLWPAWAEFKAQFVVDSGRVVSNDGDRSQTYSEGQGYALFFALLANDRPGFEQLLRWTEDNLCAGDLAGQLPAWLWGRQDDGGWGVLDGNSASDADLWIAYALGEAGRLWNVRRYRALSRLISARVLREETAELPGLGLCLLPGRIGFTLDAQRWRLNASYLPLQLMRWFAAQDGSDAPAWQALAKTALPVIVGSAPRGWAADWVVYDGVEGFLPDLQGSETGQGSYNAIRVYLWAGTLHPDDAQRTALLQQLQPMARYVRDHGLPPESIDTRTGEASGPGPAGFVAAMLPFLQAQQESVALQALRQRLHEQPVPANAYYGQCLRLFALGWLEGQYAFDVDGRVQPRWSR